MRYAKGSLAALGLGLAGSAALLHAQPAPDTDGQFVEATCATCHPIAQVQAKHQDAAAWAVTVDRMIALGAPVTSDEDRARIIAWLAAHQGPQ